jgi:hypothetical protein
LISNDAIQKSLESDNLIFVEGIRKPNILTADELVVVQEELVNEDNISAGDFQDEFDEKRDNLEQKSLPKSGMFERNVYFYKLFPSLKIQKPGYDLYGTTTCVLGITAAFVFLYYGNMAVDQSNYLANSSNVKTIFRGDMVLCLLTIILIIIIERYVNRSDTKAVDQRKREISAESSYFGKDDGFKRSTTKRSMTIKLKTLKTADLDVQGDSAQNFLQQMYGGDDSKSNSFDEGKTKITGQQKCKYVMHMIILAVAHLFIFWFIPITGNYKLYNQASCKADQEKFYGCKNFHNNPYLRAFYIFICLYLLLSALQIRHGFPIFKKTSSVLQYNDNPLFLILANVYSGLPFMVELRALLDFTFSKTSLDIFQFWQLWQYNYELFCAKNSNISYTRRIIGTKAWWLDKIIFGWLLGGIILFLLVGPLYLFSDSGGFIAPNPVISAELDLQFVVDKNLSYN